jgi:hypothetical protein
MSEGIIVAESPDTVVANQPVLDESTATQLRVQLRHLQFIVCVLTTVIMALRHQKAELDGDIASVLSQNARDPLCQSIDRLEALLKGISAARHPHTGEPRKPCWSRPAESATA